MDEGNFIVSCVEYFSFLKNIPSHKVYQSFADAQILDMILDSHKKFPEMDLDFFMGMTDGLLALESDAQEEDFLHYKERTDLVQAVLPMLAKKHSMNGVEACALYYTSQTAEKVSDEKTGFYQKEAKEIFTLIEAEA